MTEQRVSEPFGELTSSPPIDVPFAPGFNLEALKKVDPEPVFSTVEIRAGKGDQGRGPNYGPEILRSLEQQFNQKRPPGYQGHQDPDRVYWEWREPVTAWVGARLGPDGESLFVKGYVPPTATDLRTQLALAESGADVINSVSIFGLRDVEGDEVTSFDLWSLDWTPKGRAGMETRLVSVSGEQSKEEQKTMDREEIIRSLTVAEVPKHLAAEIQKEARAEALKEAEPLREVVGEMRVILELDEDADPEALVDAVRGLVNSKQASDLEVRVEKAVEGAEIASELVKSAVTDAVLPKLSAGASDEEIAAEIKSAQDLPYIAALSDGARVPVVQGGGTEEKARKGTRWA